MKKHGLFLLSACLLAGTVAPSLLVSCNNSVKAEAEIELVYVDFVGTIAVDNEKDSYFAGDIVSLTVTPQSGYTLDYVTLNGEEIKDLKKVELEAGRNIIQGFFNSDEEEMPTTRIRDFEFEISGDSTYYTVKNYTPTGSITPETCEIPSEYRKLPVRYIGENAFTSAGGTKKVSIPASIKGIALGAFANCATIDEFSVANDSADFCAIDGVLFDKAQKTLISYPSALTKNYTVPAGTEKIADMAFNGGKTTGITLNSGLLEIGESAFENCKSLTNMVIPNSVTTIGLGAFRYDSELVSITLSTNLNEIEDSTFQNCLKLSSIEIPGSVKKIGANCFMACDKLASITLNEGLEEIADNALSYMKNMKAISLPASLKKIGANGLAACEALESIELKEGLLEIGNFAFYMNKLLKEITIPASVTSIGTEAFAGCMILQTIGVATGSTSYKNVDGVVFTSDGKKLISYPCGKKDKTYSIPSGTEEVVLRSFEFVGLHPTDESYVGSYTLTTVNIPKSVTKLYNPFYGARVSVANYAGTKAEFELIDRKVSIAGSDGESTVYSWNDLSSIENAKCSDGETV